MMTNFKLGDKVKVVNRGQLYSTYKRFAERYGIRNFIYADDLLTIGDEGTVIVVGIHTEGATDRRTLLGITVGDKDYIIGESGVELIQTPAAEKEAGVSAIGRAKVTIDIEEGEFQ
jgi:hypothetical protein